MFVHLTRRLYSCLPFLDSLLASSHVGSSVDRPPLGNHLLQTLFKLFRSFGRTYEKKSLPLPSQTIPEAYEDDVFRCEIWVVCNEVTKNKSSSVKFSEDVGELEPLQDGIFRPRLGLPHVTKTPDSVSLVDEREEIFVCRMAEGKLFFRSQWTAR